VCISLATGYFHTKKIAELLLKQNYSVFCCRLYILLTRKLTVFDISLTEAKTSTRKDDPPRSAPSAPQSMPESLPQSLQLSAAPTMLSIESGATALQKQYQAEMEQQMKHQVLSSHQMTVTETQKSPYTDELIDTDRETHTNFCHV